MRETWNCTLISLLLSRGSYGGDTEKYHTASARSSPVHAIALPRPRRERPCCRAAEQRDERSAPHVYIHALQNDKAYVSALMGLYAEIAKMRALSSASVVDSADQIVKKIINAYLEPNKTLPELRQMADGGLIDPLRNFSEACRAESESLHYGPPG